MRIDKVVQLWILHSFLGMVKSNTNLNEDSLSFSKAVEECFRPKGERSLHRSTTLTVSTIKSTATTEAISTTTTTTTMNEDYFSFSKAVEECFRRKGERSLDQPTTLTVCQR